MRIPHTGPGGIPRKIAAMICLAFCSAAIPVTLFHMLLGSTGMGLGLVVLTVLAPSAPP